MAPCDIEIRLNEQFHCFDNSAYSFSGQLKVCAHKKFSFESIEIRLKGTAKSHFFVSNPHLPPIPPPNPNDTNTGALSGHAGKMYQSETHRLVDETVVVFPFGGDRNMSKTSGFVMLPGEYEYEFEIPLPAETSCSKKKLLFDHFKHNVYPLPPTVDDINGSGEIQYTLEAIVIPTAFFSMKTKELINVRLGTPVSDELIGKSKNLSHWRKETEFQKRLPNGESIPIPFYLEIRSNGFCETVGELPTFKLYVISKVDPGEYKSGGELSTLGAIYLRSIEVFISKHTEVTALDGKEEETKDYNICSKEGLSYKLDLSTTQKSNTIEQNDGSPLYELQIPSYIYQNVSIPKSLSPTFEVCNMKRDYKISIKVGLSGTEKAWEPEIFELERDLTLLSGVCDSIDRSEKERLVDQSRDLQLAKELPPPSYDHIS